MMDKMKELVQGRKGKEKNTTREELGARGLLDRELISRRSFWLIREQHIHR